jgi:5-methylcytosine-specific restriction protein B
MVDGVFKQICQQAKANPGKRYALFIDEINRANIAKVFGELITLIEGDKRARYDSAGRLIGGMEVQLPGTDAESSGEHQFGVPANLDIFGTMNTADRSIALLDIALRRRFEFEELPPVYDVLDRRVENVDLGKLLRKINDRLEYLTDRDRQIGHAYFMRVTSLEDLRACFKMQIIPLLQEFFFDDLSRVELVLSGKDGVSPFIAQQKLEGFKLFGSHDEALQTKRVSYSISDQGQWGTSAFQSLYESQNESDSPQAE